MIQAEPDPQKRDEYVQRLMNLPNQVDITVLGPMQSFLSQTHTHDSLACTHLQKLQLLIVYCGL